MYRCRRVLAIVLSLAVIASFFVFSASADDTTLAFMFMQVSWLQEDGNWSSAQWIPISSNSFCSLTGNIVAKEWRITAFRLYPGFNQNLDYWITFSIGMFHNSSNLQYGYFTPTANGSHSGTLNNDRLSQVLVWTQTAGDYIPSISPFLSDYTDHTRNSLNFSIRFRGNGSYNLDNANQTTFTLNSPILIGANSSFNTQVIPFIFNCGFWSNYDYLINSNFSNLQTQIVAINNLLGNNLPTMTSAVSNLNNKFDTLFTSTYYWTQTEYDPITGTLTNRQESGSFWNALLGSIQSISSANEQEAALQDKANQQGAGDALDDAYDSVGGSFGKLSDFSDLSDMASWNGGSFSDQAEGGLLSWFSQACKDDIDSVPKSRAPLDIIDVYTGHIQEYYAALGEDDED